MRLDLARAYSYTRSEATPDAGAAPLGSLENEGGRSRERWPAPSYAVACGFGRLGVSPIKCLCSTEYFPDTGCLYSKSPDRNASAAASEPFL